MVSVNQIFLTLATFFAMSSYASAFWFSAEEPKPTSSRMLYQQPDYYNPYARAPLPYVPFQVPIPAQMGPATVQNVQLVPCLCPVNQEYPIENEYNRKSPYGSAQVVTQQRKRR